MPWLVRNFRAFLPLVVSHRSRMCGRAVPSVDNGQCLKASE